VDLEETIISRLEELFYKNENLGIKVIGYSYNYNDAMNDLGRARDADVFLISAYLPDTMGYELINPIKRVNPNARIIVMLQTTTRNLASACREKGADDIIQKPFRARQLIETILGTDTSDLEDENQPSSEPVAPVNEIEEVESPSDSSYSETPDLYQQEFEPSFEPSTSQRTLYDVYTDNPISSGIYSEDNDFEGEKPNIVCTFVGVGSTGKTTTLVNTAVAIHKASEYKPKICIVDFNLLFPSVAYKFHHDDLIQCKKSIYDLCEDINSLSEELVNEALITHEPTGIQILNTPTEAKEVGKIKYVTHETIERLITQLRSMFDLVLIDTSSDTRSHTTLVPLNISDKAMVILEPDLANLLHTRKFINMMQMFEENLKSNGKITSKLNFILNKENNKNFIHVDTIKKTLFNTDIRLTIPEDGNITQLANNGGFVVDNANQTARSMKELARIMYPFDQEMFSFKNKKSNKKNGKNFFKTIFKKK